MLGNEEEQRKRNEEENNKSKEKYHGPRFLWEITGLVAGTRWEKIDSSLKKSVKLKHIHEAMTRATL